MSQFSAQATQTCSSDGEYNASKKNLVSMVYNVLKHTYVLQIDLKTVNFFRNKASNRTMSTFLLKAISY